MSKERGLEIATAFFVASRSGDVRQLRTLLGQDVVAYADGGGRIIGIYVTRNPDKLRQLGSFLVH